MPSMGKYSSRTPSLLKLIMGIIKRQIKKLRVCHVNVRSILASTRMLDLEILCANYSIDVLCVSETWLKACSKISLPGFQPPFRCDRKTGQRGGGVAIFVRIGLPVNSVKISSELEAVCVEVHLPKRLRAFIAAVYRPPKSKLPEFISSLESVVDNMPNSKRSTLCLVGDFNAKNTLWWKGQQTDDAGVQLAMFALTHGLIQLVDGPTREVNCTLPAQLDLMFVDNVSLVEQCSVLSPVADHSPTLLQLNLTTKYEKCQRSQARNYASVDMEALNEVFLLCDWTAVFTSSNTCEALTAWYDIVLSVLDKYVPSSVVVVRPSNKPWYSPYLRRLRRHRDRLFRRSKNLSAEHRISIAYRAIRNLYVSELRSAERAYYAHIASKLSATQLRSQPHKWWTVAKTVCGVQQRDAVPPLHTNGKLHLTATEKAECLNSFFSNQCSASSSSSSTQSSLPNLIGPSFSFRQISPEAVFHRLSKTNVWKAPGIDGICHRLLRGCASALSSPLSHIFNLSLQEGVFPEAWKTAIIQPVYKLKGERNAPSSYRPIALLPSVSKIFESFVHKQLLEHCFAVGAIPDEQYGFLPGRSTVWQLVKVVDDWIRTLDEGGRIHACFLDISKAFDKVDHSLLLSKLSQIAARDAVTWFKSYLSGRSITTVVGGIRSNRTSISSGVPQGSVLGPLLFVIFLRDLPSVASSYTALFADDTLVYDRCTGVDLQSCCRLQEDLTRINTWAENWATTFNASKSAVMVISRRQQRNSAIPEANLQLTLGNADIPNVDATKHLGIQISSKLSWSPHVHCLLKRVAHKVYIMKCLAYRCGGNDFVKKLYLSLVRPVLEYAGPVWDSCPKSDVVTLERVQLAIARAIIRQGRATMSNRNVLATIGWPTLAWRRRRFKLLLFWKLIQEQGPPALRSQVPPSAYSRTTHCLRRSTIAFPVCRSKQRLTSFIPSAILIWNSLPLPITSCTSSRSFLTTLDSHLSSDKFSLGLT